MAAEKEQALKKVLEEVQANPLPQYRSVVPLEVFFSSQKIIPSAQGGFRSWAKSHGFVKLTVPEWTEEWDKFQKRPVR